MAETIVKNVTQQTTPSTHLVRDVSQILSTLEPDLYPLDTMLRRMKQGPKAKQTKIEWVKISSFKRKGVAVGDTTASAAAGTKDIVVDDITMWRADDVIFCPSAPTNPPLLVEVVTTATSTLTVRALGVISVSVPSGFSTVPAISDGTVLAWIGNAKYEGFDASDSRVKMPDYDYNYEELFDTVVAVSKTRMNTENYTKVNDWDRARRDQLTEFRRSIEYKLWFQTASYTIDNTSSEYRWTMNGVTRYITKKAEYSKTASGAKITEAMVIDWLVKAFSGNNGSTSRFLFADSYLSGEIMKVPLANLRSRELVQVLGVKCERLTFNFGDVFVKHHRGFNEFGLDHYGVLLDLENIAKRDLRPLERNILDLPKIGKDKVAEQYVEQTSVEVLNPDTHMIIQGS